MLKHKSGGIDGPRDTSPVDWDRQYRADLHKPEMHILRRSLSYAYVELMKPRLIRFIIRVSPERGCILEAGCGTGRVAFELSNVAPTSPIIGLDFSLAALRKAKADNRRKSNLELVLADIRNLPFKTGAFDFILSLGVVEHFESPTPLLIEMRRVLKNAGEIILETPNRKMFGLSAVRAEELTCPYGHHDFYTSEELAILLKRIGFFILNQCSLDFSWGVIMFYESSLQKILSRFKGLNGIMTLILRVLTLPANFVFRESGF